MGSGVPFVTAEQARASDGIKVGEWEVSFCGCFTDIAPNCCMATCLPFISIAQIAHRMNVARYSGLMLKFWAIYIATITSFTLAIYSGIRRWDTMNIRIGRRTEYYGDDDSYSYANGTSRDGVEVYVSSGTNFFVHSANSLALTAALVWLFSSLFYFAMVWHLRSKVRNRFQLPGTPCCDCCASLFCLCCTVAQMATHVKSYKPHQCDFGPPDTLVAYQ